MQLVTSIGSNCMYFVSWVVCILYHGFICMYNLQLICPLFYVFIYLCGHFKAGECYIFPYINGVMCIFTS